MVQKLVRHLDLVVLTLICLFFLSGARYGVVVDRAPGPGAAPVLFGSLMAVALLVEARGRFAGVSSHEVVPDLGSSFGTLAAWLACGATLALLALFGVVLGSFIALIGVATLVIDAWDRRALANSLLFALVAATTMHLVFKVIFNLPLMPALIPLLR
ncbi:MULTISPECIES: tripartite tricarboxylate transporter TctB family protein [unclassified Chelatococcus]|uniref:tripartite tricarboxylate transporter TctB family protein n=1 Tax=unclassified Chelatococcus TaxID=2638111 RepID=UPI001BCBCA2C|nr:MULTISPECIES: tripartite tricarboxylate transporter TctB family protein [unclassified Chelatococcus]CAH1659653.1 membrane hypothetical protein [Hyphomicrobiales bacterium]MBS7740973.1 tripartite tricarboxylate transporter TctB family protein [Chelatococcus sp. HY11]MBX3545159.1 tripartite tricarboxylate transporter TctB family protein [Chelatococcus sp.]MCO5077792.1 tripartite tricarboxylate transporter TctB family protein [Chelatococcus sp.]CAH1683744.1 membrane hypothetical protein [Hypho